ncbi:MAG: hypothetical protein ACI8RZ_004649 [Myxococcota bacterium]|jgi:hypothetical protein
MAPSSGSSHFSASKCTLRWVCSPRPGSIAPCPITDLSKAIGDRGLPGLLDGACDIAPGVGEHTPLRSLTKPSVSEKKTFSPSTTPYKNRSWSSIQHQTQFQGVFFPARPRPSTCRGREGQPVSPLTGKKVCFRDWCSSPGSSISRGAAAHRSLCRPAL